MFGVPGRPCYANWHNPRGEDKKKKGGVGGIPSVSSHKCFPAALPSWRLGRGGNFRALITPIHLVAFFFSPFVYQNEILYSGRQKKRKERKERNERGCGMRGGGSLLRSLLVRLCLQTSVQAARKHHPNDLHRRGRKKTPDKSLSWCKQVMDETVWSGFPFSGVAVAEDIRPFQIIHALAKGTSETERQTVSCLCFHPTHGAEPFP